MASVFVPAAFLPGTTGQLYKQFAITIVVSVGISGCVALTLTPAMCALLLKHNPPPQRGFFAWFNRQVDRVTRGFGHAVEFVIKRMVVAFVLLGVFLYSIWHLFSILPTSFVPQEDQGYAMVAIIMPQAASLDRTQAVAERVDAILAKIPGVDRRSMVTGYSLIDGGFKTNAATFFITFKDFKQRYASIDDGEGAERARHPDALLRRGQAHRARPSCCRSRRRRSPASAPPAASSSGSRTPPPAARSSSASRPRPSSPRRAQRPELAGLNTTFNASTQQLRARRRPRQDDAAGRADAGRVQRDPGAVRLADGQPVQPVQPRLVGDRCSPTRCTASSRAT